MSELVALQRPSAMLGNGETQPVDAELLEAICGELIEARQLLERLGGDLRAVAAKSRRQA
jgi:hypothetical protein